MNRNPRKGRNMTQRAKDITKQILLATICIILGALIYAGRSMERIDSNSQRLNALSPRIGSLEREVSGVAAQLDGVGDDVREIKKMLMTWKPVEGKRP